MKLSKVRSNFRAEFTDKQGGIWYVTYKILVKIGRYRDCTPTFVFTKSDGSVEKAVSIPTNNFNISTPTGGIWYDEKDKCIVIAGGFAKVAGWSKIDLAELFLVPDGGVINSHYLTRFGAYISCCVDTKILSVYKSEDGYVFLYVLRTEDGNYNKSRSIFNPPTLNIHHIHCTKNGGSVAVPKEIVPYLDSYKYRSKRHYVESNDQCFYIRHKNNPNSGWCYAFKNYTWYKLGIN